MKIISYCYICIIKQKQSTVQYSTVQYRTVQDSLDGEDAGVGAALVYDFYLCLLHLLRGDGEVAGVLLHHHHLV